MDDQLLHDLTDRLEELGLDREEAEEILRELQDQSYEAGYEQGLEDAGKSVDKDATEMEDTGSPEEILRELDGGELDDTEEE